MILYDYFRSSAPYRVRIALNLKGVAYETRTIDLLEGDQHTDEHRARNPQALIPALDIGDGTILTQSFAIIDWLDRAYPEPRLIPEEPMARAQALKETQIIGADLHPINNLRVVERLTAQFGASMDDRLAWRQHWIVEGFRVLEPMVQGRRFLGGDAPGIADLYLIPQVFGARRFGVDLSPFPELVAIEERANALKAFADARPDPAIAT